ncbi:hypothetical protein ACVW1C_007835 [Bradyrhizobium sp. USDA 4011]
MQANHHRNHHHFDSVEFAFVCAAVVSLMGLLASVAWLLLR